MSTLAIFWILTSLLVLNVIIVIARIGEPREPITRADAVAGIISNSLIIWALVVLVQRAGGF